MDNEIKNDSSLDFTDYGLATLFCLLFIIICALFSSRLLHWFIFPLIPCGILIGVDAVGWFRGKYNLYDPKGILGVLGLHFFFVSYILVIVWDIPVDRTASNLNDYRPWLGLLAILNFFGLIFYRVTENHISRKPVDKSVKNVWVVNESRWFFVLIFFISIAVMAQAYLIFKSGYIGKISYDISERQEVKGGTGLFRLIGSQVPIFLMFLLTIIRRQMNDRKSSILSTYFLLGLMSVLTLICGGLVGSRGTTVWGIFWLVGIVHFFWKRFTVKEVILGIFILFLFMNIYGFFKKLGTEGLTIFRNEGWAAAAYESGITAKGILIGDFSRSNVNAYMAYVLAEKPYYYQYRWGKTLWGDILSQFPMWIYSNRFNLQGASGKMVAGTDIMMGQGHFNPSDPFSYSRYVYGLTGQVMLNFGILPIPLAFIIWGYCVGRFRRSFLNWKPYDLRLLLAPVYIYILIMLLTNDFNNILYVIIFKVSLPLFVIWLITSRIPGYLIDQEQEEIDHFDMQAQCAY